MRSPALLCVLLAITGIAANGCGAARPSQYYQLTMPGDTTATAGANAYPITLLLGPLRSSHLYREDHLVYGTGTQRMGTYEYQRWAAPPAEMIQEVLLRELRASGRYRAVGMLRSNSRGDYTVTGRLYDFKEVESNSPVARVAIEYELRDAKSGATVWSRYYSHDEPVSGKDVAVVVAALDRNVQGIVGQVKADLDQYFSAHPATASQP